MVPLFYARSADNLPRAWIQRMKACIKWVAPRFNTHRMLAEYTRRFYCPAATRYHYLSADAMARAKAFAQWKSEMRQAWSEFAVREVTMNTGNGNGGEELNPRQPQLKVGAELTVRALIKLGRVQPQRRLRRAVPRPDRFLGQHPRGHGDPDDLRAEGRRRRRTLVCGPHGVPGDRPAWRGRASPAQPSRPEQPVRSGPGPVGKELSD